MPAAEIWRAAPPEVRVVVVDDHELFRRGMSELLREQGIRVVAEAGTGEQAVEVVTVHRPDVVLMDLAMPGISGIEATRLLAAAVPLTRVLVLTILADEQDVMDALLAGACGYLLKDASIEQIVAGIRAAALGDSMISPRVATKLVGRLRERTAAPPSARSAALSVRELEVLELLSHGLDNADIASALFISHNTVKNHVSSILEKLQVQNRLQAAVHAVRAGMAPAPRT